MRAMWLWGADTITDRLAWLEGQLHGGPIGLQVLTHLHLSPNSFKAISAASTSGTFHGFLVDPHETGQAQPQPPRA